MMLRYDLRIVAYKEKTAYREAPDILAFGNARFLQQRQTSPAATDKDEFCSMVFKLTLIITHFQSP
ncbi:hypothetical protein D3C81_2266200 [compost metagenome]